MHPDQDITLPGDHSGDDIVIPYQVEALDVRGRSVRLGPLLDHLLERHDYPDPVAHLLAEVIALTVLLGTSLKFNGKFILQIQSDGPVDMLVADLATPGSVRAYARFDAARIEEAVRDGKTRSEQLLGTGILAMTIDQGRNTQRYQGIVKLDGSTLEEIAETYFRQSEQLPSALRLAVARQIIPGPGGVVEKWRAGGLLAQFLPDAPERMRLPDLPSGNPEADAENDHEVDDAWTELTALMATVEPSELIDPAISNETLLYRLFHEHGVRVYQGTLVRDDCSCSREKIMGILESFSDEEIAASTEDGIIRVACEFCSATYEFDPADFGK